MNPAQQPSMVEMFLPFVVVFVIFYFLIIRPQGKRLKEHDKFISDMKKGDQVVTNSGILGTIDGIAEAFVTLEIANGVRVKVLKKQIAGMQSTILNNEKTDKKG